MKKHRSMRNYCADTVGSMTFDILNVVLLTIFGLIVIYPLWQQLTMSLNDVSKTPMSQIGFWPAHMTADAYKQIFTNDKIPRGALISVLRVVVGTCTSLFCTALLAYLTTIRRFKGRNFMRRIFVFTMYFGGGLIPTYLLMVQLKLINSFLVYVIPGLFSAYYMLLIASYISGIPEAMFEAARIDGAQEMTIYLRIVLPCCIPVLAAIAVYMAVGHWNSWFDVLIYCPSGKWDTLQVFLRRILLESEASSKVLEMSNAESKLRNVTSESVRAATTMVVTVPILLVYPFFQKYFISGITIGSVK